MYKIGYKYYFDPQNFPNFFPGMEPFTDGNIVAGDKDPDDMLNASVWSDWDNDIFDDWGHFYLYDVDSGKYYFPLIDPQNQEDGVITTQIFNAFGRTFTIKQGYPVQGIFKFDISVNDTKKFRFGAYGEMGFDGGGSINDLTYQFSSNIFTLYYNKRLDINIEDDGTGFHYETIYSYFIPKNVSENNAITYVYNNVVDYDSLISNEITNGLLVYFSKTNDVKEWVVNDLGLNPLKFIKKYIFL